MIATTSNVASISREDPWPGLLPYAETGADLFFGRDEEIQTLFRIIKQQTATLLFGRSGLGKSSLLAAGVFPLLRPLDYFPVRIRLDYDEPVFSIRNQVSLAILAECKARGIEKVAYDGSLSIWAWLRSRETEFWTADNRLLRPVIVFDQFEEIFTRGASRLDFRTVEADVLAELEPLILDRPSSEFLTALDMDTPLARRFDLNRKVYKVVITLREDFLAQFEALASRWPPLTHNRMRLGPMSGKQAYTVVTEAGVELIEEGVPWAIVNAVSSNAKEKPQAMPPLQELERRTLSPALLSLVCRELNGRRKSLNLPKISVQLVNEARQTILFTFYDNCLKAYPPALRVFIEEELVTTSGYRQRAIKDEMLAATGITEDQLEAIIESRLLSYDDSAGTRWVELSHDLLTKIVLDSKVERKRREALEAVERQKEEALADAAKREKEALAVAQKRYNEILGMRILTVVCLLCVLLAAYCYHRANMALIESQKMTDEQKVLIRHLIQGAANVTDASSSESSGVPTETSLHLLDIAKGLFANVDPQSLAQENRDALYDSTVQLFLSRAKVWELSGNTNAALDEINQARAQRSSGNPDVTISIWLTEGDIYLNYGKSLNNKKGVDSERATSLQKAIASFNQAVALSDPVSKVHILALLGAGDAYRYSDCLKQSEATYETAKDLAVQYDQAHDDDRNDLLATSFLKLGNIRMVDYNGNSTQGTSGDLKAATDDWNQALQLRLNASPGTGVVSNDMKSKMVLVYANLSGIEIDAFRRTNVQVHLNQARSYMEAREKLSEECYDSDPSNPYYRELFAQGLARYANSYLEIKPPATDDLKTARDLAAQAIFISGEQSPFPLFVYARVMKAKGDIAEENRVMDLLQDLKIRKKLCFEYSVEKDTSSDP